MIEIHALLRNDHSRLPEAGRHDSGMPNASSTNRTPASQPQVHQRQVHGTAEQATAASQPAGAASQPAGAASQPACAASPTDGGAPSPLLHAVGSGFLFYLH